MIETNPIRDPKLQNLEDSQTLSTFLQYAKENVTEERPTEALLDIDFYSKWISQHPNFAQAHPAEFTQLQQVIVDNQWIALRMLWPVDQIYELFNKHLLSLLTLSTRYTFPYPRPNRHLEILVEDLRIFFTTIESFDDRDKVKKRLLQIMLESDAPVTTAIFFYKIKQATPSTRLWIDLYERYMGEDNASAQRRQNFLTKTENGAALTPVEREWLNALFELYHRLHELTISPFGLDEEIYYEDGAERGTFVYGEKKAYDPTMVNNVKSLFADQQATVRPPVMSVLAKSSPVGSVSTVTGPDLDATTGPDHFSEEDEREIARLAKDLGTSQAQSTARYTTQAHNLVDSLGLTFATQDDEKKFVDLVASVLRGLREQTVLKDYLVDLQFPSAEIDAVLAAVQQQLGDKPAAAKPVTRKLAAKPTMAQLQKKQETKPAQATTPVVEADSTVSSVVAEAPRRSFLPKLRRSRAQKRQIVDDVKLQPTMVMGPIDELRAMDTVEFRRISPDPYQAAARIKDKIELLGEESVAKQAEGVEAFKQSSLNTLYLELGNTSMSSGRSVAEVIAERERQGTPTLSVTEFAAIADLNKQIRF